MDSVGVVAAAGRCPTLEPCRWSSDDGWWVVKAPTLSLDPMSAREETTRCPRSMPASARSDSSTAKPLFSRFPAHCVVLMFNSETCQRIVRSSTGMSVLWGFPREG